MSLYYRLLFALGFCLLPIFCRATKAQPVNIALGKAVTFTAKPNYPLCSDADDNKQLTDGTYSAAVDFHKQKSTVGWRNAFPIIITIDLETVQPISGVSYSTTDRQPGFGLSRPTAIYLATSDDQKTWRYTGDLVELSPKPQAGAESSFRYATHRLKTRGRYIALGVAQPYDAVVDEIEVYRGDAAWLDEPNTDTVYSSVNKIVTDNIVTTCARRRLNEDIAAIRNQIQNSTLPVGRKKAFEAQLEGYATAAQKIVPSHSRTVLPLNDIHRDILAVHGAFLETQRFAPLVVWKQHRYGWLPFISVPAKNTEARLDFSMLRDQFRSDALLLTNASGQAQSAELQLDNIPPRAGEEWIKIYSVVWTDTAEGTPVADALLPIEARNGAYQVEIPAGMTRKIWLTVDSSKVPAGAYESSFTVRTDKQKITVPLHFSVSKIAMQKPRLSLGVWDFTNGKGGGRLTVENRQAAIELMRSHYVDTAWATRSVLPMPGADDFDEMGQLKTSLDFSALNQWISLWPGARNYYVFKFQQNLSGDFAGEKMGSPQFNARVGSWAKALAAYMRELGLQPSQLGIEIIDESHTDAQDAIIAAWAKAIKAAAPELTLFSDPFWWRPDRAKIQEAITQMDVLSPLMHYYQGGGAPVQNYYQNLRARGKKLWFYQCSGPVRLYNPQHYYRYQAWQAFESGAVGQGFWSFCDTNAPTSWNEYVTTRINFEPAFIDKDTVYSSIHWEAVREGMEDNEELSMLADAIQNAKNVAWKESAKDILGQAVAAVLQTRNYNWQQETNPGAFDGQLQRVRRALEEQSMDAKQ